MVTGRPPFVGESPVSVASKHVRENPPAPREINPAVPPDLEAIILKCMAKSPEYRYATGDDLRVDLLRFREGRAVSAGPVPAVAMGDDPGRRHLRRAPRPAPGRPASAPRRTSRGAAPASTSGILVVLLVALAVVVALPRPVPRAGGSWPADHAPGHRARPRRARPSPRPRTRCRHDGLKSTVQADSTSNAAQHPGGPHRSGPGRQGDQERP